MKTLKLVVCLKEEHVKITFMFALKLIREKVFKINFLFDKNNLIDKFLKHYDTTY